MDNLLPQPQASKRRYLITGGHGFIGSHIARRMFAAGEVTVRIVDIAPTSAIEGPICHEFLKGNLLDMSFCEQALEGVDVVIHLAANMGGMGTIHDDNDFLIYQENHMMTINILQASLDAGVKQLLYASSACVYPQDLQSDQTGDVSLRETAVWTQCSPPSPQGLYGLEKLHSENIMLLEQFATKMDIRIARFHNIFGPGGSWKDGREKAPAAMLRKALALKRVGLSANTTFEVWGDGYQRRSFLYVLDAVDGIMALLQSRHNPGPINIGSDRSVTIQDLANMALECVGLDPKQVSFSYHLDKPVGVISRNSNNERVKEVLDWEPKIKLLEGMQKTCEWMTRQLNQLEAGSGIDEKFLVSKVIHLRPQKITFAILLPITSRGTANAMDCLLNLRRFAKSLVNTTWRDTRDTYEGVTFRFAVYLAIDADDEFLLPHGRHEGKAQAVLRDEGVFNITSIYCDLPRGHVCALWRKCAKKAWVDGCDYLVLMGDDIILHDEGWMRKAYTEFSDLANELLVPYGFGCVAFTDISFPGMPTFPIVHRTHMDIFGEVVPEIFVNQDGDPFLFQLYRRWNSSRMFTSRISNGVGGENDARYSKAHAQKWKFGPLDQAVSVAHNWLHDQACNPNRMVTIDVVIPCYRVDISILDRILSLKPTTTACVMFIIIIDDPLSPNISQLESKYSSRPDVRIRVNRKNLGASASRNRGMEESAADWIHFLDDDVVPRQDLLEQAEKAIRSEPRAIGFVGKSMFPVADTVFTAAVHLAGVTYFWGIAGDSNLTDDVPWGVTANLITRRVDDSINFDLKYPKTGGGEDIDFCRLKRQSSLSNKGKGFIAAPDVQLFLCVILANTLDDYYRHMWKHPERTASLDISIRRGSLLWRLSVIESTFIRMFSEIGRLRGLFLRGEYTLVMKRFDWFAGRLNDAPIMEERINSMLMYLAQ
ncbi:GDP-mannose 3,5-epimerase 2 [Psilocybe cubensis]|uniref:GDP-mannose 3,5-epimerase 2 n=1 Tax=Psilocybe cubensis TaxID=181762 RepID=A0ACB8GL40_PSICU|nr:GDP-mannose 3,5-epimerase 2 [Psilocybe cubensis]KAH9475745.1 GDP-mannose 3,5-epimerase 2 [Psilocybe cubensis]